MLWEKTDCFFKYHESFCAALIPMFNASESYWMSPHLAAASECLPPLFCSRPRFLILSCSAYLACAQRVEAVMSIASTPLPMWTGRAPSHTSARAFVEQFFQCHTHANTHTHHMNPQCAHLRLQPHGPGGNDRFKECCGWRWTEAGLGRIFVTCYMQRWRGVMTSSF